MVILKPIGNFKTMKFDNFENSFGENIKPLLFFLVITDRKHKVTNQGRRERGEAGGASPPSSPSFPGAKNFFPRKIGKPKFLSKNTCDTLVYLLHKT